MNNIERALKFSADFGRDLRKLAEEQPPFDGEDKEISRLHGLEEDIRIMIDDIFEYNAWLRREYDIPEDDSIAAPPPSEYFEVLELVAEFSPYLPQEEGAGAPRP